MCWFILHVSLGQLGWISTGFETDGKSGHGGQHLLSWSVTLQRLDTAHFPSIQQNLDLTADCIIGRSTSTLEQPEVKAVNPACYVHYLGLQQSGLYIILIISIDVFNAKHFSTYQDFSGVE